MSTPFNETLCGSLGKFPVSDLGRAILIQQIVNILSSCAKIDLIWQRKAGYRQLNAPTQCYFRIVAGCPDSKVSQSTCWHPRRVCDEACRGHLGNGAAALWRTLSMHIEPNQGEQFPLLQ